MLPPLSPHPLNKTKKKTNNTCKKKKNNKQTKNRTRIKTNKQIIMMIKSSHQLSRQNLWLWTVALNMCYKCLTISLTTADSWLIGLIYEVVTPQRPNQDWQVRLQSFSWKLGSCRGVNSWRLSEQSQSPYLDWGNMWGRHIQRQC